MELARLGDDLRQFLQRVDLLGHGAAHRRRRFLGLFRHFHDAALHLLAGFLQFGADIRGGTADFLRRAGEPLGRRFDDLADRRPDAFGRLARLAFRAFQHAADEVLEILENALDGFRLRDEAVRKLLERRLPVVQRRGEAGLRGAEQFAGIGENLAMLVEPARNGGDLAQRAVRSPGETLHIGVDDVGGIGEAVDRLLRALGEFACRRPEPDVEVAQVLVGSRDEIAER